MGSSSPLPAELIVVTGGPMPAGGPTPSPLASPSGWGWASADADSAAAGGGGGPADSRAGTPSAQSRGSSQGSLGARLSAPNPLGSYRLSRAEGRPWSSDPWGLRRTQLLSELPPEPPALPPGALPPDPDDELGARPAAWLGAAEFEPLAETELLVGAGLLTAVARVRRGGEGDAVSDDPDLLPARLQLAIDDFDGARALDLPRPVGFKPVQPTVLAGAVPPPPPPPIEAVSPVVHVELAAGVRPDAVFDSGRVTLQLPHCHAGPAEMLRAYFRPQGGGGGGKKWVELGRGEALLSSRQTVLLALDGPGSVVVGRRTDVSAEKRLDWVYVVPTGCPSTRGLGRVVPASLNVLTVAHTELSAFPTLQLPPAEQTGGGSGLWPYQGGEAVLTRADTDELFAVLDTNGDG